LVIPKEGGLLARLFHPTPKLVEGMKRVIWDRLIVLKID